MDRRGWAFVLLVLAFMAVRAWVLRPLIDFHVFYTAAVRVLEGSALYIDSPAEMPYKYAPAVALFIAPFGVLPERASALVWMLLAAAAYARFLWFCRERWYPQAPLWTIVSVGVLTAPFLRHLFNLGQCDLFILWFVAESELRRQKRPFLSGALLALAVAIKLPYLIFFPLLLLWREWRRIGGFAAAMAGFVLLPVVRYGWSGNLELIRGWNHILSGTSAPLFCAQDNQSVFGLVCTFFLKPEHPSYTVVALGAAAAVFAGVVIPLLFVPGSELRRDLLLAAGFYLNASLSPLGWRTNLVGLAPMLFVMFAILRASPGAWRWLLLAAPGFNAFFGLIMFDVLGRKAYDTLLHLHMYGVLAVATALGISWAAAAAFRSPAFRARPAFGAPAT